MKELAPGGPVVDVTAVLLTISGGRPVELNPTERMIAAAFILAGGGRQLDLRNRLGISRAEASRMHARICQAVNLAC
jgi:uncharacterized membrane protein